MLIDDPDPGDFPGYQVFLAQSLFYVYDLPCEGTVTPGDCVVMDPLPVRTPWYPLPSLPRPACLYRACAMARIRPAVCVGLWVAGKAGASPPALCLRA